MKLIVPVLNRFDLLRRMIDSIDVESTVYVINNSGRALPFKNTNRLVSIWWIDLPSNLGVASSWNLGIKMLPFEFRWFFTSADCVFMPGDLALLQTAKFDALTLCDKFPFYQTFAVGEEVVEKIGLFDESLHPIYFEDNDFERRLAKAGLRIDRLSLKLDHDNSSTINSDSSLSAKNQVTFLANQVYFESKVAVDSFDEGRWSLKVRRANSWD